MKNIIALITTLTLFIAKGFTQVIAIHCDTLQNFRFVGQGDPIIKLELEAVELTSFTLEDREFIFDLNRMELYRNGDLVTNITELMYYDEDLSIKYQPLNDCFEGHVLITKAIQDNVKRGIILFWEINKTHTIGSFGYLD